MCSASQCELDAEDQEIAICLIAFEEMKEAAESFSHICIHALKGIRARQNYGKESQEDTSFGSEQSSTTLS